MAGVPVSANVLCDEWGREFVWRQPRDTDEVAALLEAAWRDPFEGYGWDGDDRWTAELVHEWWDGRDRIDTWLEAASFDEFGSDAELLRARAAAYRRLLSDGLERELESYASWLASRAT